MITQSLTAWILHKQCAGDSSVRVTFFSAESGLLTCFYKGGRGAKKQSFLQSFVPLWLHLMARHDRYYVQSLEATGAPLPLEGSALFSGFYLNELLYYVLQPEDPAPDLFQAYSYTLNRLALTQDPLEIERLLRRFEWVLLKANGLCFSFTQEARTGEPVSEDARYQFIPGEGFVKSTEGMLGTRLLALASDQLADKAQLKVAKTVMREAMKHLLGGRELRSRALYGPF